MKEYDIIISGGGLVGATLAIALSQQGFTTALIEKQASFALVKPIDWRHIALSHGSHLILQGLGIWPDLMPYAQAIEDIHVSDKGRWGCVRLSAKEQHLPALGFVIAYPYLLQVINAHLENTSSIAKYSENKIIDCEFSDHAWQVTLDDQQTCQAKLLISAEGSQSFLRKKFNIEMFEKDYEQTAIVANLHVNQPKSHTAFERFSKEGPIAILPTNQDYMAVIWAVRKDKAAEYLSLPEQEFIDKLQAAFGYRVGKIVSLGQRQSFPLQLSIAKEKTKENLLFVGNAAFTLHPIAAQGFNLALRDIASLIDELKLYTPQEGFNTLLAKYITQREKDHQRTVRFTDGLILLFSNDFFPFTLLRNWGMAIIDLLPTAKAFLGRYGAGRLGRLPLLARGIKK